MRLLGFRLIGVGGLFDIRREWRRLGRGDFHRLRSLWGRLRNGAGLLFLRVRLLFLLFFFLLDEEFLAVFEEGFDGVARDDVGILGESFLVLQLLFLFVDFLFEFFVELRLVFGFLVLPGRALFGKVAVHGD